jgi:single-strand DNA-binding protein
MSVNKVILVGNVGKDPDTRHLEGGNTVSKFSLATSEVYKNKVGEKITNTEWHNIVLWKGLAEIAEKYVKKGSQLYIEGRIRTRSYTDQEGITKYTTEIIADSMQMLGKRAEVQSTAEQSQSGSVNPDVQKSGNATTGNAGPIEDLTQGQNEVDDLPF